MWKGRASDGIDEVDQPIYADSVLFGFYRQLCTWFDAAHLYSCDDRAHFMSRSYCAALYSSNQIYVAS